MLQQPNIEEQASGAIKEQKLFEASVKGLCKTFMLENSLNTGEAESASPAQNPAAEEEKEDKDDDPFDSIFKEEDKRLFEEQQDPTTASKISHKKTTKSPLSEKSGKDSDRGKKPAKPKQQNPMK